MTQEFSDKVQVYLRERLGWRDAKVLQAKPLAGGISRETWKVDVEATGSDGAAFSRSIVLRIDPAVSLLDSKRNLEFAIFRALEVEPAVPVPETICNENDASHIGSSFMALSALPGVAEISAVMQEPYASVGPQIARAHINALGAISRFDFRKHRLNQLMHEPSAASAALDTLLHWEEVFHQHQLGQAPITEAAIRHLKRRPPEAARVSLVHGDFRLGNCLFLPDGTLSGVLDWEMAHLGDSLEDLAWAMHPTYRPSASPQHLVAGYLTEDEVIRAFEEASGIEVDREILQWWQLFVCVKSMALFSTGGFDFIKQKGGHLIYAVLSWGALAAEEARMLDLMGIKA